MCVFVLFLGVFVCFNSRPLISADIFVIAGPLKYNYFYDDRAVK